MWNNLHEHGTQTGSEVAQCQAQKRTPILVFSSAFEAGWAFWVLLCDLGPSLWPEIP